MNQNPLLLVLQGKDVFGVNFLWERMEGRRETLATVKRHWGLTGGQSKVTAPGTSTFPFPLQGFLISSTPGLWG